jgi:IS4 transposase
MLHTQEDIQRLANKLHPGRFSDMSPKMAAMLSGILGESWTEPVIHHMAITSDGHLIDGVPGGGYLGVAADLERNVYNLLQVADLTPNETRLFLALYRNWINPDYRNPDLNFGGWMYYSPFQEMLKDHTKYLKWVGAS